MDEIQRTHVEETCLKVSTARKMIQRFLIEKQMPKEKIAEALGITTKNLEQIFSCEAPSELMSKIELCLIKFYCKTKWV